jgi:hypothetical protein
MAEKGCCHGAYEFITAAVRSALPSLTFLLLDSLPAAQAGLAGGLFNAGRPTGGALAVATFGSLVAGSFMAGLRLSMMISAVLLLISTAARVPRFPSARLMT